MWKNLLLFFIQGDGKIKADMDLTYDVELLKIEAGEAPPDVFGMIDKDDNRKLDKTEVCIYSSDTIFIIHKIWKYKPESMHYQTHGYNYTDYFVR